MQDKLHKQASAKDNLLFQTRNLQGWQQKFWWASLTLGVRENFQYNFFREKLKFLRASKSQEKCLSVQICLLLQFKWFFRVPSPLKKLQPRGHGGRSIGSIVSSGSSLRYRLVDSLSLNNMDHGHMKKWQNQPERLNQL